MKFDWDDDKRRANVRRHGIDFVDVETVFERETVTILDERFSYDEDRFITLGMLKGRVVVIAHTETVEQIRIISVRKATKSEEIRYIEEISGRLEES